MKRTGLYIILAAALAGTANTVNAQDPTLSKEITVETDFVPVERKVSKLNTLPVVVKTSVPKKQLSYSDWSGEADIPFTINKFEPYGYDILPEYSTAKGYFDLGAGSQLNITGSAGYRFIDSKEMKAGAWLQHNSSHLGKNSSPLAGSNPLKQKFNDNILGVNFSNNFSAGTLCASAYYHFDNFNYYGADNSGNYKADDNQTVNEFAIKAAWNSVINIGQKIKYSAQVKYNHFGYSKGINDAGNGLKENNLQGTLNAETVFGKVSTGINITADYLGYSNMIGSDGIADESGWMGMVKLSPYFRYKKGGFRILGGINLDLSNHDGSIVKLSPNIKADMVVDKGISLYVDVTGGKDLNLLSRYHTVCRYLSPETTLGSSYRPLDAEIGLKIGAFGGLYVKPYFGYGIFKNQVTPYAMNTTDSGIGTSSYAGTSVATPYVFMQKTDIKGWKGGLEIGYKYNNLLDIKAILQHSPQDLEDGYIIGLDRASTVLNIQAKVTPLKPLSITLGYELRNGRKYYSYYGLVGSPAVHSWGETSLESVNNLSLDACYQMNKTISVFVYANNLFNKQWDNYFGMGAQKLNTLAGVNVVF